MSNWRSVVADTAHVLSTPLTAFDDMEWTELLLWDTEARRIAGGRRD